MRVMMFGYGFGWGAWLWMLGGLLLTVGIVVLIVWAISGIGHAQTPDHAAPPGGQTPLDILRERYARGEISEEEFERARKVLGY